MSEIMKWFDIFYKNYICLNLSSYENIGVDLEIVKIILAVAFAALVCGIALDYNNKSTYLLVKQLLRHDAVSEDKAKTLGELGLGDKSAVKCALRGSGKIKSIVARCGEQELTYEEYMKREAEYKEAKKKNRRLKREDFFADAVNFEEAKFYIREESKPYAMKVFNGADVSIIRTILRSVLIVIVSIIIVILMPDVLSLINNMLG